MDRRQHRRMRFNRDVDITLEDGRHQRLEAQDLSLAGIGLRSLQALKTGDLVRLRFRVSPRGQARILHLRGTVRHIEPRPPGYVLGVGFIDEP